MKLLFAALFLAAQTTTQAQTITGKVKDEAGKPVEKATVSLLNAGDSSIVKLNATNAGGSYQFNEAANGKYLVMATNVGYSPVYSAVFDYSGADVKLDDLTLERAGTQLAGVVVTTKKPLVEVKADKMIVNVEGTINATGNDGIDLLRRSPGVMVDKDDNISMAGKNGVEVYIDGKPSPLKGTELGNYLRSIPSSSIESIELITNPSAKYEAAGNAGIINIRLKKDKTIGTNGTVTAGYNIGIYGKYNGGLSLNHRGKKFNVYGNYNYSQGLYNNVLTLYRDVADTLFDQRTNMIMDRKSHNVKAGADYYINSKSTVGIMANTTLNDDGFNSNGPMPIIPKATGVADRILQANTATNGNRDNYNLNANYKYADTSGHELNVDLDYARFNNKNNQRVSNIYYENDGTTVLSKNLYRMYTPTGIDIYSLKTDYQQRFLKGTLGYGFKLGWVNTNNDFQRFNNNGPSEQQDLNNSNKFDYKENINAGYLNYNRQYKGFLIQAGLRLENTNSQGRSTGLVWDAGTDAYRQYDSTLKRNYTDLFPSAAVTINKNPMSQWNFTYSRRIDRPNYSLLNPFEFALNDYTYMKGNTQLTPQYTNSFGITHTYKYKLNTTLNYSHIKDMFAQIIDVTEGSKSFQTTKNLASQDVISLNISYPFSYKSYSLFTNLSSNYSKFKADFGGGGRAINTDAFSANLFTQSTLKFAKTWTAELSTLYLTPFIWQGAFKGKAMGFVDAGVQKTVFQGKGTVKASVSDIFKTMHFSGTTDYANQYTRVGANWESRQFKLNFTYRFGSAQIKAARQRKTGLDEEKNRAGDSGGAPGQSGQK
ncbi:outer membrane beta-barrel family protein [Niabella drilacis]|uniref:Outer membrane receptor proteins, mostly Fe transport n=1 Tax=Niabella drilacis (strain DSM 25811 / CCM 8410 / CCUG 62505 / LMG 26954 / E90) TaxID=1285928 RepID=A0A1G6Q310_NIADE|nr:outer membrane beta-barrel family protein [Niabella drilacis]SDC86842.1 Outer membrane receptor proteins, mostly Fe transport [Niabella drilacis]